MLQFGYNLCHLVCILITQQDTNIFPTTAHIDSMFSFNKQNTEDRCKFYQNLTMSRIGPKWLKVW